MATSALTFSVPRVNLSRWRGRSRRRAKPRATAADEDGPPQKPEIVVVGLGPGDPAQITLEAWDILTSPGARVHVRTAQHPTLEGLPPHVALTTFDHVYERTKNLEDVYPAIADELFDIAETVASTAAADVPGASAAEDDVFTSFVLPADEDEVAVRTEERQRRIVYAVPGDPCVAENSVAILRARAPERGVALRVVPGLSFLEPTLAAVGADVMPSLVIVDAIDVARAGHAVGVSVDAPLLLCQLYSTAVASDVKLTLMQQYPEDHPVRLVHAAGTADEIVETLPLHDMDRTEHVGILSSAFIPAIEGDGGGMGSLLDVVARTRNGDAANEPEPTTTATTREDEFEDEFEDDARAEDGAFGVGFGEDTVWMALDHADDAAVEALRAAGEAAADAAARDAAAEERAATLGRLQAAVALHVSMAAEAGEFTMRDVVREAIAVVREDGGEGAGDGARGKDE